MPPQVVKQTASFQYEPLDPRKQEIRLLQLCSSQSRRGENVKIVGHLLTVPLDQAPPFECLSYTWEKPGFSSGHMSTPPGWVICINGYNFNIKENLYEALLRLMHRDTTRLLWADALCIDQSNQAEVGDQVAKMGVIYTTAVRVLVWLGEPIEATCLAFSLLDDLFANIHDDNAVRSILKSSDAIPGLNSLTELFARDYWSRVWVVQEIHFARNITVHCGDRSMPWAQLIAVQNTLISKFLGTLDEVRQLSWPPTESSKHIWNLRHVVEFRGPKSLLFDRSRSAGTSRKIDLFEGLMMHRLKRATDPRDKIYAIVGLTTAASDPQFVIDYGLPAQEVFINTVDYLLKTCETLDIILINTKLPSILKLPTWIPDFASWWEFIGAVPFRHASLESAYTSSATKKAEAVIDYEKGILSARGVCIGSIASIAPSVLQVADNLFYGNVTVQLWKSFVLDFFHQNADRLAEFSRLLVCDIPVGVNPAGFSVNYQSPDILSLFEEDVWRDEKSSSDQLPLIPESKRKRDRAEALAIIHNIFLRRLFVTDKGAIGMAQDSILKGDLVCILFGCSIPVILRRVEGQYHYISDACVVGYMYGNGIEELEAGKLEAELFEIC